MKRKCKFVFFVHTKFDQPNDQTMKSAPSTGQTSESISKANPICKKASKK